VSPLSIGHSGFGRCAGVHLLGGVFWDLVTGTKTNDYSLHITSEAHPLTEAFDIDHKNNCG